jgi:hypothetical protein
MKKLSIILFFPIFLLVARFVPFHKLPSTCPLLNVTGYPCPTCGMTRSVEALAHLDFTAAFHFNILGLPFVLFLGICWICGVSEVWTGRRTPLARWIIRHGRSLGAAAMGILLLSGAIRIWLLAR